MDIKLAVLTAYLLVTIHYTTYSLENNAVTVLHHGITKFEVNNIQINL